MPGTVTTHRLESRCLRSNPLGDPHVRDVAVYLPASYARSPSRRYPVVYFLTGFTGRGTDAFHGRAWDIPLNRRIDRLRGEFILVAPDGFTRYGGSQYLNSSAVGRYEDFIARELVRWTDATFRTIPHRRARAVMGKSSGGYGAIVHAMRHADVFGLCACHSGDMLFEYCYLPEIPRFLTILPKFGGTVRSFLRRFERMPNRSGHDAMTGINIVAMSACYAPNPRAPLGFDVPWDEKTGAIRWNIWERFRRWDPVVMAPRCAGALRSLDLLFIDCGTRDEFQLHHGARVMSALLKRLRVPHVHEKFDDGHMNIAYRYDRSLGLISRTWRRMRL